MKKLLSVLLILVALVTLVSCASSAKQAEKQSEETTIEIAAPVADVEKEDIPVFLYEAFVPEENKQYLGVILEDIDGYTWNPQYTSYEDFYALFFLEDDVQYEKNSADGKMYYVFKFQAKEAAPELTFNCLLKKDGVAVAGVEVKVSIDADLNITLLSTGSGPAISSL